MIFTNEFGYCVNICTCSTWANTISTLWLLYVLCVMIWVLFSMVKCLNYFMSASFRFFLHLPCKSMMIHRITSFIVQFSNSCQNNLILFNFIHTSHYKEKNSCSVREPVKKKCEKFHIWGGVRTRAISTFKKKKSGV